MQGKASLVQIAEYNYYYF